jgi:F-type H+-transporting ATPase subunit delta
MADYATVARPYAKAVFAIAKMHDDVSSWSAILFCLSEIATAPLARDFLYNPLGSFDVKFNIFLKVLDKLDHFSSKKHKTLLKNFLLLLYKNKRLQVLPNIYTEFQEINAEHDKTIVVKVATFSLLTEDEKGRLIAKLSEKLGRKVTIEQDLNPAILGGAIIYAGDLVIDGSVRGKLDKLRLLVRG